MNPQPEHLHDAGVISASCGPRREVNFELSVVLKGEGPVLHQRPAELRFGAIDNYEAVSWFVRALTGLADKRAFLDTIDSLARTQGGWTLVLDHAGPCEIRTTKPPRLGWREAV